MEKTRKPDELFGDPRLFLGFWSFAQKVQNSCLPTILEYHRSDQNSSLETGESRPELCGIPRSYLSPAWGFGRAGKRSQRRHQNLNSDCFIGFLLTAIQQVIPNSKALRKRYLGLTVRGWWPAQQLVFGNRSMSQTRLIREQSRKYGDANTIMPTDKKNKHILIRYTHYRERNFRKCPKPQQWFPREWECGVTCFPFFFIGILTFKVEDILVVCPATLSKDNSSPLLSLEPSTISLKAPEISPFCEQVGEGGGWCQFTTGGERPN